MDITGVVGFAKDFGTTGALADAETDSLFDTLRDGMLELYRTATNPTRPLMVWDPAVARGRRRGARLKATCARSSPRSRPRAARRGRHIDRRPLAAADRPASRGAAGRRVARRRVWRLLHRGHRVRGQRAHLDDFLISQHPDGRGQAGGRTRGRGPGRDAGRPDAARVTYADLNALPYLSWVCKEAMRVKPVASSGTTRKVKRDLVVGGTWPRGATVLCPSTPCTTSPRTGPMPRQVHA